MTAAMITGARVSRWINTETMADQFAHQKYVPNGRPRGVPKGYIRKAKP